MPPVEKLKEPKVKKKPGRRPTSCAECRRLKLKCDKNVPCGKCVSRGCASVCPDGCMAPTRGNRMVVSGTEELHERIDDLRLRIQELEDALRELQARFSDEPHPLLQTDILRPRRPLGAGSSPEPPFTREECSSEDSVPVCCELDPEPTVIASARPHVDDTDSSGTLLVHENGSSKYVGKTARPELLMALVAHSRPSSGYSDTYDKSGMSRDNLSRRLPPMSQASHLCELYLRSSNYLYAPLSRTELFDSILGVVYGVGHAPNSYPAYHETALLFAAFALSIHLDGQHPATGHDYYQLSRAALEMAPPTRHTTLTSIQTMIHLAQYQDFNDWDTTGSTSAWLDVGQALRLGISIGLHLNPAKWKLPHPDVEKRKRIFWQLLVADTWSSFYLGRPPTMSSNYIDCPVPKPESGVDSGTLSTFQIWTYEYTKLLNSVMAAGLGPTSPAYSCIVNLDRQIREFPIPHGWTTERESSPLSADAHFHRWFVLSSKETTLLNLHRPYFAQALCEQREGQDLQEHRYITSIVSVYRSAWRITTGLQLTWAQAPGTIQQVNLPWSQALSAAIVLCLLITRAPTSHLVSPALEHLGGLLTLFHSASHSCRPAANLLPSIQKLYSKACDSVNPPHYQPSPSTSDSIITQAELDRLGGKTHLVTESAPMYLPPPTSSNTKLSSSSSSSRNGSVPAASGSGVKLESLHPVLAQDLKDYGRGQHPSLQTLTDGDSRNASPAPSTTTASSGSSGVSQPYPHTTHILRPPQARQTGDGYHPSHALPQREGYGGGQYVPPPAYNQQQQQQRHQSQSSYPQRPSHLQQPLPAHGCDGGTFPGHPERKLSTLTPPTMPGFDPTIEMLDASWQSLVEQLGY